MKDSFAHLRDVVAEHDGLGIGEPATYFSPMDNEVIITDPEYGIVAISTADIKEVVDSDEDDDVVYSNPKSYQILL